VRFGLISLPGGRHDVLADARLAVDAGFDLIATADHLRHPRDPAIPSLDGWSVLAALAVATERLRIAMLVSNLIYRHPVLLAKQAIAVDQLSGGRLDLGIGAGVYATDHAMAGVPAWSARERVGRLSEFVRALDSALRGAESFHGDFYSFDDAAWSPGPVQVPRPPIALGAVGPRMLRLTAEMAEVWSAFGGFGLDDEEAFFAALQDQTATLDQCCEEVGRDPGSLRRSLLAFRPLTPWRSPGAFEELVHSARRLGFDELVLYTPASDEERQVFELVAATLPSFKLA
jgi:alkanesulfonate monooxygenase SsuD/methylene tetrahydromethanopterin reductase-like flavin-dependent oxidoreductase (luciferase family)